MENINNNNAHKCQATIRNNTSQTHIKTHNMCDNNKTIPIMLYMYRYYMLCFKHINNT